MINKRPELWRKIEMYRERRPDLVKLVSRWNECGMGERHLLSLLRGHRMKCLLRRMLAQLAQDEQSFYPDDRVVQHR